MTTTITPDTPLTCGCCGVYFRTWENYVDQDQDEGYGICAKCQQMIERKYDREMDRAVATLASALNEKNRAKLLSLSRERQEELVLWAIEAGHLTWTISPSR